MPNEDGLDLATRLDPLFVAPTQPYLLAKVDSSADTIEVYPLNITSTTRLFEPKHGQLETIRFEGQSVGSADDLADARMALAHLPMGFVKRPEAGFGIDWDLRSIVDTLDVIGVKTLVIKSGRQRDTPKLDGSTYILSTKQFDELRRLVRRVHAKALGLATDEKLRAAHNALLTPIDPVIYPEQPPTYREGGVTALIANRTGDELSPGDQAAVISAATTAVKPNKKKHRKALLRLSQKIETVTLRDLIAEYQTLP